jgi:FkbM family methyltransferase
MVFARAMRAFADVRACAPLIGWGPAVGDRLLKRLGVKELRLKAEGLPHRVYCRVATSDIFEYAHLLGRSSEPLSLPLAPKVIVDAGANVGYSSLKFQKQFPGATIIAIEPEARNAVQFRRNCGHYPNIALERKALWTRSVSLRIRSLDVGQNAFRVEESQDGDIEGISVTDLMSKYGLDRIDLFKIDIEGSERTLFSDPLASAWLSAVRMILVEDHDRYIPGCTDAIRSALDSDFSFQGMVGEYKFYVRTS